MAGEAAMILERVTAAVDARASARNAGRRDGGPVNRRPSVTAIRRGNP
jgi:hypothetical protein